MAASTRRDWSTDREPSSTPGRRWEWRSITAAHSGGQERGSEVAQAARARFRLRQQREGDESVGGQQVKSDRPISWMRQDVAKRAPARRSERIGKGVAGRGGIEANAVAQRRRC